VGSGFAFEQTEVRDRFAGLYLQQRVRKNLIKLCGHGPFVILLHEVRRAELRSVGMDSGHTLLPPAIACRCLKWSRG
jgi:hypothetical protein